MTGAPFHLAFNHVPVVLVPVAVVMLSYAMVSRRVTNAPDPDVETAHRRLSQTAELD